jgi:hypothetical protein
LHGLQAGFESFARLDKVAEGLVVIGLDGQRGIVRRGVEERRLCEIKENWEKVSQGSTSQWQ